MKFTNVIWCFLVISIDQLTLARNIFNHGHHVDCQRWIFCVRDRHPLPQERPKPTERTKGSYVTKGINNVPYEEPIDELRHNINAEPLEEPNHEIELNHVKKIRKTKPIHHEPYEQPIVRFGDSHKEIGNQEPFEEPALESETGPMAKNAHPKQYEEQIGEGESFRFTPDNLIITTLRTIKVTTKSPVEMLQKAEVNKVTESSDIIPHDGATEREEIKVRKSSEIASTEEPIEIEVERVEEIFNIHSPEEPMNELETTDPIESTSQSLHVEPTDTAKISKVTKSTEPVSTKKQRIERRLNIEERGVNIHSKQEPKNEFETTDPMEKKHPKLA